MSKRILVVEDQEDNRQIIRDMLTFTDYEISEAESGEGKAIIRTTKMADSSVDFIMNAPCLQGRFVLPILAKAAVQRRRSSAFAVLRRREANSSLDAQSQWRVLPGTTAATCACFGSAPIP